MALLPGTQQTGAFTLTSAYPGDWVGDRGAVTLSTVGRAALGDCAVGNGVFLFSGNGNQVCVNATTAGATSAFGIVLRNQGAPMPYPALGLGYATVVPDTYTATVATSGDVAVVGLGVGAAGTANHVPVIGDLVWANGTTGAIATAPASVTTITGYLPLNGWQVTKVGLRMATTYIANQTGIIVSK